MHLPDSSAVMPGMPVTFPPGRTRLSTSLLGGRCRWREPGHDHIDFEAHQFRCQLREAVYLSFVRTELEMNVLPIDVTEVTQCLGK
jgi:hypothetical protein